MPSARIPDADQVKHSFTQVLRVYTCGCGFALLGIGIFGIVDGVDYIKHIHNGCEDSTSFSCGQAVELASTVIAMTFFIILAGLLIIATELHLTATGCCHLLPRYFGFLCVPLGRGLFLSFCGLVLLVVSKVYQGDGKNSHLAPLVVGFLNVAAGVLYIFCATPCCTCLTPNPLRTKLQEQWSGRPTASGRGSGDEKLVAAAATAGAGPAKRGPFSRSEAKKGSNCQSSGSGDAAPAASDGAAASAWGAAVSSEGVGVDVEAGGGGGGSSSAPAAASGADENPFFGNKHMTRKI